MSRASRVRGLPLAFTGHAPARALARRPRALTWASALRRGHVCGHWCRRANRVMRRTADPNHGVRPILRRSSASSLASGAGEHAVAGDERRVREDDGDDRVRPEDPRRRPHLREEQLLHRRRRHQDARRVQDCGRALRALPRRPADDGPHRGVQEADRGGHQRRLPRRRSRGRPRLVRLPPTLSSSLVSFAFSSKAVPFTGSLAPPALFDTATTALRRRTRRRSSVSRRCSSASCRAPAAPSGSRAWWVSRRRSR